MDQFDQNALLQYHQQAITHALAPQQSQKQIPCQLVFPDNTMAIGSPAVVRGALFPTDRENTQESEEDRQRRLLQNEPIVVYTSLSDQHVLRPEIFWRSVVLVLVIFVQCGSIVVILMGGAGRQFYDDEAPTPSTRQAGVYCVTLVLHAFYLLANIDSLKGPLLVQSEGGARRLNWMRLPANQPAGGHTGPSSYRIVLAEVYSIFVTLLLFLIMVLAMRSFLDLWICVLCVPVIILTNSIRELMMPHCFTIRR
jgi:hypothetical protein